MSVKDEFYHRHIIQHNLFAPVFAAFRTNPVGDNLVSSAIVEMCDFIHRENITSLISHIVTKHRVAERRLMVEVNSRVATLRGRAPSYYQRQVWLHDAKSFKEVEQIVDLIEVT